jgi:uncharacterized OB-fold protein
VPLPGLSPPAWGPVGPFWDGAAAGELRLPRCNRCRAVVWYPEETGAHCDGAQLTWETLPGTGTVYTHTTVRRAFPPSTEPGDLPVVVVLVEPDGAPGVRVVGNLVDGEPRIGQRVRMEARVGAAGPRPVFVPQPTDTEAAESSS